MDRKQRLAGVVFLGVLVALGVAQSAIERSVAAQTRGAVQAPRFEVDFAWPKPLPNHWVLGNAIGVWADERDHIWIVHRGSETLANNEKGLELKSGDCCAAAPPVLEFDADGRLVGHWGGPGQGYDWPDSNHGIFIDHVGNVWIGGNGPGDSHIVKFTRDGKFLAQYGKPNARMSGKDKQGNPTFARNSHDEESFGRVAKIFVDPKANEAYIADGYFNKRVAVIDAATGKMKRYWGAYGKKPDDAIDNSPYDPAAPAAQQFRNPVHCADMSKDGLVYVCDRLNDRLQVFKSDGTLREGSVPREEHQAVGIGVGRRVLTRSATAIPLRRRRHQRPRLHPAARLARDPHELRRRRTATEPVLRRAQHRHRLEGQHLHHGNVGGKAPAEVRLQGPRARDHDASRHGVAADGK